MLHKSNHTATLRNNYTGHMLHDTRFGHATANSALSLMASFATDLRMPNGDAFSLYSVLPVRQDTEQQVGDALIQQVDLVHIQDPPVGLGQ